MNIKIHNANKQLVATLVDVKVAVHKHDKVLDDKIEDFKGRLGAIEGATSSIEEN